MEITDTNLGAVAEDHQSTDYKDQHELKQRNKSIILHFLIILSIHSVVNFIITQKKLSVCEQFSVEYILGNVYRLLKTESEIVIKTNSMAGILEGVSCNTD